MIGASDFLRPGAGWLPDSWVLDLGVKRALRLAARDDPGGRRQYDEPLGYAPLRQLFSVRLAERGVPADPDQIVVTDSCSQALDLVCRFLLSPERYGGRRRSLLLQFPCAVARQSGEDRPSGDDP